MEKDFEEYPYKIMINLEGGGRIGSYYAKTPPPRIGEKINLVDFAHHTISPEMIKPMTLYEVIDVVHKPENFYDTTHWDAHASDLDSISITVRPVLVNKKPLQRATDDLPFATKPSESQSEG
jgi:hypothetical protein